MILTATDDPILRRFKSGIDRIYGERIERAVLFGSRARGDAGPGSDYDIAIFLHDPTWRKDESIALAWAATELLHDTGAILNPLTFPAGSWRDRTAFMAELRRDGIDL